MTRWILAIVAIVAMSGCVNIQTMALRKGQGAVSTGTQSVALMAVEVSRADESRYQPFPTILWVTDLNRGKKTPAHRYQWNRKGDTVDHDGQMLYFASLSLAPGRYQIEGISGVAMAFPFVGNFFIPVLADFEVKPDSVSYIGHLKAIMRERREGEFRAGSVIPLIDQGATGMISHSWDVIIDDQSEADLARYREHVPGLSGVDVKIDMLPPWDRAAAQRRWDGQSEPEPGPQPKTDQAATPEAQ